MSASPITLPRDLVNRLLHQAQESEQEICGLIGAVNGHPHRLYPIINVSEQPHTRYHMDPALQIAALRELRENGETLFAIYHSHPTSPAQPSQLDLLEWTYPEALCLIVSLNTRGVLELRGFRMLEGKHCEELELLMSETCA
jgi:proteasome lid subunit RPN8/RPN11